VSSGKSVLMGHTCMYYVKYMYVYCSLVCAYVHIAVTEFSCFTVMRVLKQTNNSSLLDQFHS